jgi:apolipoprotein N-acyltransferase
LGISLWNISQFIIPQNKKKEPFLSTAHTFIEANSLNQKDLIITPEPDYLINYLEYHQLINSEKQSIANIVGDNSNLDSLLTEHSYNSVYIIKPKKQLLNRFSITHNAQLKFTLKDRYSIDTVEHYALEVIKIRQLITNSND